MSIAPPVGAMSAYLAKLISGGTYRRFRRFLKRLAQKILPKTWEKRAARAEEFTRGFWTGGTLFEELGFYYVGPIDGHNFDHLLPVLRNVRAMLALEPRQSRVRSIRPRVVMPPPAQIIEVMHTRRVADKAFRRCHLLERKLRPQPSFVAERTKPALGRKPSAGQDDDAIEPH